MVDGVGLCVFFFFFFFFFFFCEGPDEVDADRKEIAT